MRNSALNVAFYCCYYYFHNSCRYIQSVLCLVQLGAFVAEVFKSVRSGKPLSFNLFLLFL